MKSTIILAVFAIVFSFNACYAEQDEAIDTIVETGICDRDISSFLKDAAAKHGEYFSKIYGECANGHISVRMDSNGKSETFNDVKKASFSLAEELALFFPLYTAQVDVYPAENEKAWNVIQWGIENGKVTSYYEN